MKLVLELESFQTINQGFYCRLRNRDVDEIYVVWGV
jgi:hypothetical protein